MTDKELRKLSRMDLLEILVEKSKENERLKLELEEVKKQLSDRMIKIEEAGSIAEAALKLNGIFEAAQAAADQYLENLHNISQQTSQFKHNTIQTSYNTTQISNIKEIDSYDKIKNSEEREDEK